MAMNMIKGKVGSADPKNLKVLSELTKNPIIQDQLKKQNLSLVDLASKNDDILSDPKTEAALEKVLRDPTVQKELKNQGLTVNPKSAKVLLKALNNPIVKKEVLKQAKAMEDKAMEGIIVENGSDNPSSENNSNKNTEADINDFLNAMDPSKEDVIVKETAVLVGSNGAVAGQKTTVVNDKKDAQAVLENALAEDVIIAENAPLLGNQKAQDGTVNSKDDAQAVLEKALEQDVMIAEKATVLGDENKMSNAEAQATLEKALEQDVMIAEKATLLGANDHREVSVNTKDIEAGISVPGQETQALADMQGKEEKKGIIVKIKSILGIGKKKEDWADDDEIEEDGGDEEKEDSGVDEGAEEEDGEKENSDVTVAKKSVTVSATKDGVTIEKTVTAVTITTETTKQDVEEYQEYVNPAQEYQPLATDDKEHADKDVVRGLIADEIMKEGSEKTDGETTDPEVKNENNVDTETSPPVAATVENVTDREGLTNENIVSEPQPKKIPITMKLKRLISRKKSEPQVAEEDRIVNGNIGEGVEDANKEEENQDKTVEAIKEDLKKRDAKVMAEHERITSHPDELEPLIQDAEVYDAIKEEKEETEPKSLLALSKASKNEDEKSGDVNTKAALSYLLMTQTDDKRSNERQDETVSASKAAGKSVSKSEDGSTVSGSVGAAATVTKDENGDVEVSKTVTKTVQVTEDGETKNVSVAMTKSASIDESDKSRYEERKEARNKLHEQVSMDIRNIDQYSLDSNELDERQKSYEAILESNAKEEEKNDSNIRIIPKSQNEDEQGDDETEDEPDPYAVPQLFYDLENAYRGQSSYGRTDQGRDIRKKDDVAESDAVTKKEKVNIIRRIINAFRGNKDKKEKEQLQKAESMDDYLFEPCTYKGALDFDGIDGEEKVMITRDFFASFPLIYEYEGEKIVEEEVEETFEEFINEVRECTVVILPAGVEDVDKAIDMMAFDPKYKITKGEYHEISSSP